MEWTDSRSVGVTVTRKTVDWQKYLLPAIFSALLGSIGMVAMTKKEEKG